MLFVKFCNQLLKHKVLLVSGEILSSWQQIWKSEGYLDTYIGRMPGEDGDRYLSDVFTN